MRRIKSANGIRRKILYGFVILGCLLFFSGAVSFFELMRFSENTSSMMDTNRMDIEISKRMLDAVQEQNTALLQIVNGVSTNADSIIITNKTELENAFVKAVELHENTSRLIDVEIAKNNYNQTVDQIFIDSVKNEHISWFTDVYTPAYQDLTLAVKNFMLSTQDVVNVNTEMLKNNAYRAIMPGIITLGIAIIIIIVFFGLIDLYYIKPVLNITKSLGDYLKQKTPFKVKVEGHDEVLDLKEHIDGMVEIIKKKE